jgi:hypothetical protein
MNTERTERINLRLSAGEKKQLRIQAISADMSFSELVVALSKSANIDVHHHYPKAKFDEEALIELRRIGNNLNQVARVLNADPRDQATRAGLAELQTAFIALYQRLA